MKIQLCYYFLLLSITCFAQSDRDQFSNEGKKEKALNLHIGTDLLTGAGGSPNLYGECHFYDKVGIQLGVGYMGVGYLADFGNQSLVKKMVFNVSEGIHYSTALRYVKKIFSDHLKVYGYVDYKKWSYSLKDIENNRYFRYKVCAGFGIMYRTDKRIGFDANIGFSGGRDWYEEVPQLKVDADYVFGPDLGISIYYAF
jgi:hypothetical protein